MQPDAFLKDLNYDVSRETSDKLSAYVSMLKEWQSHINLISDRDNDDKAIWSRHIKDSLQLVPYVNKNYIVDIGSGGGLPAIVLAIATNAHVVMVESDKRKCIFLNEVIRKLFLNAEVKNERMEYVNIPNIGGEILITSRACASISKLLWLSKSLHTHADFLLLKGEKTDAEITEAQQDWNFNYQTIPSITHEHGRIVFISGVSSHGQSEAG